MLHLCVPSAPVCLPLSPAPDPKASRALFLAPQSVCLTSRLPAITDLFYSCLLLALFIFFLASCLLPAPRFLPTDPPVLICVSKHKGHFSP